jgi:MFS family permease
VTDADHDPGASGPVDRRPSPTTRPDRAARSAVTVVFALNGALVASWLVRIPATQARLGIAEATLGLVLMGLAVGVLLALPVAGGASARLGSRRVAGLGAALGVLALPLTGLAPTPLVLAATLIALGAGTATMDVGMNAQGIGVEAGYGRSILVGMHASWSLGALLAAVAGAVSTLLGVSSVAHLAVVSGLVTVAMAICLPWLRVPDRQASDVRAETPRLALPRGPLVPIAVVAVGSSFGESTGGDWSGIFMRDTVGVPAELAPWGFVALMAAMTLARLLGDRVTDRIGAGGTVAWGGRLAGAGFLLLALAPWVGTAVVGFLAFGVGVASITPLAFAAAGRTATSAGAGMAAVASVGYAGFLLAPPMVGGIAELLDLRAALGAVGLLVLACTHRPRGFDPARG